MIKLGKPNQKKAVALVLLLSCLYIGSDSLIHLFDVPKLKVLDLVFGWRTHFVAPPPSINDITIVTFDEDTIEKLGNQWPYRRSIYGYLIKELSLHHPKVIAFDFVFAGMDLLADDNFLAQTAK